MQHVAVTVLTDCLGSLARFHTEERQAGRESSHRHLETRPRVPRLTRQTQSVGGDWSAIEARCKRAVRAFVPSPFP